MTLQKLGSVFLFVQAVGALIWWVLLVAYPESRRFFLAQGAPDVTLLAFGVADSLLFIGASFLAGYGLWKAKNWAWSVLCIHAGAASYATLYCWTLVAMTGGDGLLGALLMSPSCSVVGFLVWVLRPKKRD